MNNAYAFRAVPLLMVLSLFLSGCGSKKKGNPYRLSVPTVNAGKGFTTQQSNVGIVVDAYNSDQCLEYFGVDLLAYNIQPVVFELHNNTPEEIEFRGSYIELELLNANEVAHAMHYSTWLWAGSVLGIGWSLFAPLMWYTPFMVYSLYQANNHINESVAQVTYDGSQPVLVFEPYTRNHFMICTRRDTFKHLFGVRFFVPNEKKLINMVVSLRSNEWH